MVGSRAVSLGRVRFAPLLLGALSGALVASCLLDDAGRGAAGTGGSGGGAPCDPTTCDDGSPCTDDACSPQGTCEHSPSGITPDDGNECTADTCEGEEEKHTALPDGAPCGLDGLLQCEGGLCKCQLPEECGADTPCRTYSCESSACKITYAPKGTLVGSTAAGDCQRLVCDGLGDLILEPDEGDPPAEDGNECTLEACDGDEPILHAPAPDDTPCGPAPTCSPAGDELQTTPQALCASGVCAAQPPISCGPYACNDAGTACRDACSLDAHCVPDAYCDGGACTLDAANGATCVGDSQCASAHCMDGVCCDGACDGLCEACDAGPLGQCQPIPAGTDPEAECPGAQVCGSSQLCVKPQGDSCASDAECLGSFCEDGVCCNNDCAGSCRRCDLPGNIGACTNVPAGQTSGACAGAAACDGAGDCKLPNGSPCPEDAACLSGFCSDEGNTPDVCCDTPCDGLCQSCRASKTNGPDGTCSFITDKTDPDMECSGSCSGSGVGCCKSNGTCY